MPDSPLTGSPKAWATRLLPQPCFSLSASTASSTSFGVLRGERLGRRDRSTRPASPLSEEAPDSPPRRIAGDGRSSGCFPEATTLLEGAYDLQSELRFALLVGELTGSGERKCQHGGTPPFMAVCGRCHTPSRTHQTPLSPVSGIGHPRPGLFTSRLAPSVGKG